MDAAVWTLLYGRLCRRRLSCWDYAPFAPANPCSPLSPKPGTPNLLQGGKPAKPEGGPADFVALDETRSRLLYFKPCADVEDGISVPKRQLVQFPNMHVTKKMLDSHLYIFSRFDPLPLPSPPPLPYPKKMLDSHIYIFSWFDPFTLTPFPLLLPFLPSLSLSLSLPLCLPLPFPSPPLSLPCNINLRHLLINIRLKFKQIAKNPKL
jgi:hypothetical protein